jgi:hypothetical protein
MKGVLYFSRVHIAISGVKQNRIALHNIICNCEYFLINNESQSFVFSPAIRIFIFINVAFDFKNP